MTAEEKKEVMKLIKEEKLNTRYAEERTKYQLCKNLQDSRDELYILEDGIKTCIEERKTTMIQMQNFLGCVTRIINNLKTNDLWQDT